MTKIYGRATMKNLSRSPDRSTYTLPGKVSVRDVSVKHLCSAAGRRLLMFVGYSWVLNCIRERETHVIVLETAPFVLQTESLGRVDEKARKTRP